MSNQNTIGAVLKSAGLITISGNRCKCTRCGATGRADTLNIKHKDDCSAFETVVAFMENLKDDKELIPDINLAYPIELNTMLPYYAELTKEEMEEAESLATAMFAEATKEGRNKLLPRLYKFEPSLSKEKLMIGVLKKGLETNTDRINFRNFLAFIKVHTRDVNKLKTELFELDVEGKEMRDTFYYAFKSLDE